MDGVRCETVVYFREVGKRNIPCSHTSTAGDNFKNKDVLDLFLLSTSRGSVRIRHLY